MSAPTFAEVIRTAMAVRLEDVHVSMPGRVVSYDRTTQSASVLPLIKRGYTDETGARQSEALPVINDVPVVFPGAGDYSITFPVNEGDTVLLVFSEQSLDRWLYGRGNDVDPGDDRRFALSDAIAIPGLRPFGAAVTPMPPTNALVITAPDEIRLGSSTASDPVVRQSDLSALRNWINAHAHASNGAVSLPALAPITGSSKVKAD